MANRIYGNDAIQSIVCKRFEWHCVQLDVVGTYQPWIRLIIIRAAWNHAGISWHLYTFRRSQSVKLRYHTSSYGASKATVSSKLWFRGKHNVSVLLLLYVSRQQGAKVGPLLFFKWKTPATLFIDLSYLQVEDTHNEKNLLHCHYI